MRLNVALALAIVVASSGFAQVTVAPAFADRLRVKGEVTIAGPPTQMVFGPDQRLYISTNGAGVISANYKNGVITDIQSATANFAGGGIGFISGKMYLSTFDGKIWRLSNEDGDRQWGEAGETNVAIVTGLPVGDHSINQIATRGKTLYVGVGTRTINGHTGALTGGSFGDYGGGGFWGGGPGNTYGESAYGGTICWIRDVSKVPSVTGAANAYTDPTLNQALIQTNAAPYANVLNKLIVHSAGTRNPYGLAFDNQGNLFFTSNFNRTNSVGDGTSGLGQPKDQLDNDFSNDVHDQFFGAVWGADYGYRNTNWRGVAKFLSPTWERYQRVRSITYDASFNPGPYALHDPANPDGLGPHSAATGFDFFNSDYLREYAGWAFIARYNESVREIGKVGDPFRYTLSYSDVVAVNPADGTVRQALTGFASPIDTLWDRGRRLIVADYHISRLVVIEAF